MKKLLLIAVLLAPASAASQVSTGTVSGEIRTREGQPAVGVRVSAMAVPEAGVPANSGTALVSIGMTDNQGRYRLENVLPGRYYITAGFVDGPTFYPGVAAVSGATVVNVLSSTPVTGINFAVANSVGVTVSGRVRSSTGTAGVGGQPVALVGGAPPIQQTTTAADGSFQFLRVRPGSYQLSSAGRIAQQLPVAVGDQDVTGLEIVVIPTVIVTGNVVVEGNAPRPRVQLLFSPFKGTGQNPSMSMLPDGTYRSMLPEGEYRVSWSILPVGYEIKSITSGSVDLLSDSLKVAVDTPPSPIRVLLSVDGNPWVKVSGRVTNLGSNRTLLLGGPNVDPIQLAVNPDGTFEIAQVLPGTYQLRFDNTFTTSLPVATQLVSVVIPNQDTTNLIIPIPLTQDGQEMDIVVNASGADAQGRLSLSYPLRTPNSSSSGLRTIATQPNRKFTLAPPPPPPFPPPQSSVLSTTAAINRASPEAAQANLSTSVPPAYPALANAARVQGNVVLQVEISILGLVQNITVLSGNPLLNEAAIQAVRRWTYKPFVVNGQTVPVITTVTVNFTLP